MSTTVSAFAISPLMYPAPPTGPVTDKYFDLEVMDAFRPLENDTSKTTLAWVNAENALTRSYLDGINFRGTIKKRLSDLHNYKKTGLPWRAKDGGFY